ncbi:MAG: 50S ribosomal protein L18 [Actinomycetota bacterium]
MKAEEKVRGRSRRHRRVRKKIFGVAERPRLAVYRSNRHVYAQLIDDAAGRTLASASTLKDAASSDGSPKERAKAVGSALASRAKDAGISEAIFDRGGFRFHGRVKAIADGAREGGLRF